MIWQDSECWIIGGGASIAEQFNIPEDVIERKDISEFSPYLRALHNKHVIGVNAAFMLGNWVDVLFFGDDQFYSKNENKINGFEGLKISCAIEKYKLPDSIRHIERLKKFGISEQSDLLYWNESSGAAAINLAIHFGVKKIFLLGFDMCNVNDKSHFHKHYGHSKPPYERHLLAFEQISKDAEKLGVEIINCSPNSAIKQFSKMTIKEALVPKIGIVTPTCSIERKPFLDFLKKRVKEQTLKPYKHYVIDYTNEKNKPDLAIRYKRGIQRAFADGCEFVVLMEDDDFYPKDYIEKMYQQWEKHKRPDIIGLSTTIYYHLANKGYKIIKTTQSGSAHNTAIGRGARYEVGNNQEIFYDLELWKNNRGVLVDIPNKVISIKHGIGLSGGSGHRKTSYSLFDVGMKKLAEWTDSEAMELYKKMSELCLNN